MYEYIFVVAALRHDVFYMNRPVIFTYEEFFFFFHSTNGFSDSNLLGRGKYGSIYYGLLLEQLIISILQEKVYGKYYSHDFFGMYLNPSRKLQLKE